MSGDELIPRARWVELFREEDFRRQIALRNDIAGEMVGSLYPRLLAAEIADLSELMKIAKRARDVVDRALGAPMGTIEGLITGIEQELPHLQTIRVDVKTRTDFDPEPSDVVITVDRGELDTPEKEARIREAIYRVAPIGMMFELKEEA